MEVCFEGDPLTVQAILKKDALDTATGEASITLFNTLTDKECKMEVSFDTSEIKQGGYGFQLAAKKMIDRSEALQLDNKSD